MKYKRNQIIYNDDVTRLRIRAANVGPRGALYLAEVIDLSGTSLYKSFHVHACRAFIEGVAMAESGRWYNVESVTDPRD